MPLCTIDISAIDYYLHLFLYFSLHLSISRLFHSFLIVVLSSRVCMCGSDVVLDFLEGQLFCKDGGTWNFDYVG